MTDNEIISALEVFLKAIRISGEQYIDISTETLAGTLNLIYNLKADKEALIAGQETLQKAYEALKADEEREHQYCKNVCEPKYKARIESLQQNLKEAHIDIKEKQAEIQRLQSIILCFMDEVSKWENKHGLDVSELPLIPIKGESEKIIGQIKAGAIKEAFSKLKSRYMWEFLPMMWIISLEKELVGED